MNVKLLLLTGFIFLSFASCKKDKENDELNIVEKEPEEENEIKFPCNGSEHLCDKQYDNVVYVTTHNAFNYQTGGNVSYTFPNQNYPLKRQMDDGVRALMLDVYEENGKPIVYHGFAWTGKEPFVNNLKEVKDFLVANPHEIITLILECYVSSDMIETAIQESGLNEYLFAFEKEGEWPTLKEMIAKNQRLVVLSDKNDANGKDWYLYVWKYAVETPFSNNSLSDFTCTYNRGNPENSLFILNHFATNAIVGTGNQQLSTQANTNPFLLNRVMECQNTLNRKVNYLTVDFYANGDVFKVAELLNQ